MKRSLFLIAALVICFLVSPATAADMSYNQITVGYASTEEEVGVVSVDGDGFGFTGTYALNDKVFVALGYSSLDYDLSVANVTLYGVNLGGTVAFDVEATTFGAGFHTPISEITDLILGISHTEFDLSAMGVSGDASGTTMSLGFRSRVKEAVELIGGLKHQDIESSTDTGFFLGGNYYFKENVSFGASYSSVDDADAISFGLTYDY